jgi:hypothetical protein
MKLLAIILFGISTGAISAHFGILVSEEPIKYFLINGPLVGCFVAVLNIK